MTVTSQTNKIAATAGNGVATTWSFSPMVIFAASELQVTTTVIATGVETVRTQGTGPTNWSTSITTFPATGSITYPADEVTPLPSTETLTIKRVLTLEQQMKANNQGGYLPKNVETQFDKLLMVDLQQQEILDRSFRFPVSYTGSIPVTTGVPAASRYLRINAAGTAMEWAAISTAAASASDSTPVDVSLSAGAAGTGTDFARDDHVHLLPTVSVAKGGTGSTTAAAARTALGLVIGTDVEAFESANVPRINVAKTWTAGQSMTGSQLTDAANISWDLDSSNLFYVTLAGNRTLDNPSNLTKDGAYTLIVTQDGTGSRTLAYGAAFKWPAGVAPVLTTAAGSVDILSFVIRNSIIYGSFALDVK